MKLQLLIAMSWLRSVLNAQTRQEINLKTWDFSRDNQSWEKVNIPHDWAIAGPFDKKWDLQKVEWRDGSFREDRTKWCATLDR